MVDFTFGEYEVPSLSFLITLGWKSILFDIRMATPAFFFFQTICLEICFPAFPSCKEGTVIEFKVTTPDGREVRSNIKLQPSDLDFFQEIMNLKS